MGATAHPGRTAAVLFALHDAWPEVWPHEPYTKGACILATRTAIEVGRYFGVTLTAQPLSVVVLNPAAKAEYAQQRPIDEWPPEAWSVGTHCTDTVTATGWEGHLIVVGDGMMADLTAGQFDRPEKGIRCAPWVMPVPTQPPPWGFEFGEAPSTQMVMLPCEARAYRQSPDWRTNYRDLAAATIRRIRPVLEASQ